MSKSQIKQYHVLQQIAEEQSDFNKPINLVPEKNGKVSTGWQYHHRDLVNAITLGLNSTYKDGPTDSKGRRKIYINDLQFISDVNKKNIDIDLKNWLFIPESIENLWYATLFGHDFFYWARVNYYNELQDRYLDDFVDYGTTVQKCIKGEVSRVSILRISITQDADSILTACTTGGFFAEHHEFSKAELKEYPNWKTDVYDMHDGPVYAIERYGHVKRKDIQQFKGEEITADDSDSVLAMTIGGTTERDGIPNHVMFIEEITEKQLEERYQEGWYQKVDGRWLGRGPVEQALENQVAKNITANLRLKSLEWAVKRAFQSASSGTKNSLATQVSDGDVIEVSPQGEIKRIDTSTHSLADFQQMDVLVDTNRERKTFTFEAATGETMPSGTAFRLGLIQQQSTNRHYGKKQELFGAFLKRGYFEQLVPKFKRENKDHTLPIMFGADGTEELRQMYTVIRANKKVMEAARRLKYLSYADAEAEVLDEIAQEKFMLFDIRKDAYKDVRLFVDLVITGESQDIPEEITSLSTLYQSLAPTNPQAAQAVLNMIFAKKGKDLSRITGGASMQPPQPASAPAGANFAPPQPQPAGPVQ